MQSKICQKCYNLKKECECKGENVNKEIQNADYASKELARLKPFEDQIKDLKSKYSDLKVNGIDDKENYEIAKIGYRESVTLRTSIEKARKAIKAPVIELASTIDTRCKDLTKSSEEIEAHLLAQKKIVDDEKKRIEDEKREAIWKEEERIRLEEEERIEKIHKEQEEKAEELRLAQEKIEKEKAAIEESARVMKELGVEDYEPVFRVSEFGDSAIDCKVILRAGEYADRGKLISDVMRAIKKRFDKENIEIPFPQIDVHTRK